MGLKQWLMRRRTRAKRQDWRRMDAPVRAVGEAVRIGICLLAVCAACGVLVLFSAHQPALQLLHRWLPGIALLFALLLAGLFALAFRGWLGRSLLAIPVGALLSYAAAPLAFHLYMAVIETATWRHLISSNGPWTALVLTVAVWPSFLLAWLFGAVAAGLYLAAGMLLELRGIAATLPETEMGTAEDAELESDPGTSADGSDNRAKPG
jgi:hypothetical protein